MSQCQRDAQDVDTSREPTTFVQYVEHWWLHGSQWLLPPIGYLGTILSKGLGPGGFEPPTLRRERDAPGKAWRCLPRFPSMSLVLDMAWALGIEIPFPSCRATLRVRSCPGPTKGLSVGGPHYP